MACIAFTHWLMTGTAASPWNAVAVLAPMLIAIAVGAWRAGQWPLGVLAALSVAALFAQAGLHTPLSASLLYRALHDGQSHPQLHGQRQVSGAYQPRHGAMTCTI